MSSWCPEYAPHGQADGNPSKPESGGSAAYLCAPVGGPLRRDAVAIAEAIHVGRIGVPTRRRHHHHVRHPREVARHALHHGLSKISVKYAKISQNIDQISLNFSQNFAPSAALVAFCATFFVIFIGSRR